LLGLLRTSRKPAKASQTLDFLIPLSWQCTLLEPSAAIYRELAAIEAETGVVLSFTPGFPAADFPHCGAVVLGYAEDGAQVSRAVGRLMSKIASHEKDFAGKIYTADE